MKNIFSYFYLHFRNAITIRHIIILFTYYYVYVIWLTGSRLALRNPRLMRTDLWLDWGVSSSPVLLSCPRITLNGYCFLSSSIVAIVSWSSNHCSALPFSAFVVKIGILSSPYSPHANSMTEEKNNRKIEIICL